LAQGDSINAATMSEQDVEKGVTKPTQSTPLLDKTKGLLGNLIPKETIITSYDPEALTKWSAIFTVSGSIFTQRSMWAIMFAQIFLAFSVAGIVFFTVRNPNNFSAEGSITSVIKTISVMITFLLGLFLSACVGRWWETVKSLEGLFGACKKLVMTSINLEVPKDARQQLAERCVLSVMMLHIEMKAGRDPKGAAEDWDKFKKQYAKDDEEVHTVLYESGIPEQQRSFYAWVLVSSTLTELRKKITIPGTNEPDSVAYQALCGLVQDALANVSALKTVMAFQLPFVYAHMLAVMVHSANILTSIGTGVTVGLMIGTSHINNKPTDVNAIGGEFFFLLFQAFIYQAILTIGTSLSFPVGSACYSLPLGEMTDKLKAQLYRMNSLVDELTVRKTPRSATRAPRTVK